MAKSTTQLRNENYDLGKRLALCSNSGEGRKVRREIENLIKKNTLEIIRLENLYVMNLTEADVAENPI